MTHEISDPLQQSNSSSLPTVLFGTGAIPCDAATVHRFIEIIHEHAARLSAGRANPGNIQLVRIYTDIGGASVTRFRIGDVDGMADDAIAASETGHNVYVEPRAVVSELRGPRRGGVEDTRFVFAVFVDSDADKGKASALELEPSFIIETSPGNAHHVFLLSQRIRGVDARDLTDRLPQASGDTDSAPMLRVVGTVNYPNRSKSRQRPHRGRHGHPQSFRQGLVAL
jgi:hypothetical protein